jgi:hypothetical protein
MGGIMYCEFVLVKFDLDAADELRHHGEYVNDDDT